MIGLGALGYDARPAYNRTLGKRPRKVGMDVIVCTPETLADRMARIIRGWPAACSTRRDGSATARS